MTIVVVLAVLAAALCWPRHRAPGERIATVAKTRSGAAQPVPALRRSVVLTAALAVVAVVVVGGSWLWAGALVAAGIVGARARQEPTMATEDVALAADLMAACLAAGAGVLDALAAASAAVGGRVNQRAVPVVDELRRGSPPEQAWAQWLAEEQLAPLARSCVRSSGSGAAVASELARVAARLRARHRALVHERVARASVWVVLPLGLCFLPAFVVVGVVPLVIGLLHTLH